MGPELLDPIRFGSDGLPSLELDCYALGMAIYEVNDVVIFLEHLRLPICRYLVASCRSIIFGLSQLRARYSEGSVLESL